jgi:hypothetical protein
MTMKSPPVRLTGVGTSCPPLDMVGAAEASLSTAGFQDLMHQTGGAPPTPEQLCAAVEQERRASN